MEGSSVKYYIDGKLEFDAKNESFSKKVIGVETFNANASSGNLTGEGANIP